MSSNDLETQHRAWLPEAYPGLFSVAFAITQNPRIAEEVVSIAVVAALDQMQRGTCRANEKGRFFAWVRTIVRNRAKTAIGAGTNRRSLCRGDIMADLPGENIREKYANEGATAEAFIEDE